MNSCFSCSSWYTFESLICQLEQESIASSCSCSHWIWHNRFWGLKSILIMQFSNYQMPFLFYFFFHVVPLPEADRGFWGCFSVCHFWARVTSSVIRITSPNCCYFTVSKNVPLKIPYKYFTSSNKEGLWTAFSLFNRRKHLLQPGKNPPTSAKRVCWTLCTGLILSLDKLQCIRVCWQRDKPLPWGSI